jgi:two-component system, NtrC family, response regulator AtoC
VADCITETVRLLVVSRGLSFVRPLCAVAESNSWHVETAGSAWDAMERVQSGVAPHVLLLDLPRGDEDGLHILRWLRRLRADLPVIVVCFAEDAVHEKEAMRLGAQEVLVRPFDEAALESSIYRQLLGPGNRAEIASEDVEQLGPDSFFVSACPATQKLRAQARLLAEADVPVLILGEAGSGKDSVARLIHKLSVRSGFKFLKVNCADMPGELLEAELFGYERLSSADGLPGAGKFERAEKGTLFIDEITEMPLSLQGRLVQMLQERVLIKLGSDRPIAVDVRILATSSANIERALAERKLREDLYYRLSAFTVQVPPLRQRRSEIAFLLRHSMHQLAKQYGLPPREFSSAALEACQNYSWPGNLKQLESFVKRYLVAGEKELNFSDAGPADIDDMRQVSRQPAKSLVFSANQTEEGQSDRSLKSLIQTVKSETERNAIATALQKTGWNRKAAARMLRVSYRTLLYKIAQYHMTASESFLSPLPGGKFPLHGSSSKGNDEQFNSQRLETVAKNKEWL